MVLKVLCLTLASFLTLSASAERHYREVIQDELDEQVERFERVEGMAKALPGNPEEPLAVEEEQLALEQANELFLQFISADCRAKTYNEGAIGGSALGVGITLCETERVKERIDELLERYQP